MREVSDLRNQGKEVVLVSSGAIMVGKNSVGMKDAPDHIAFKQAWCGHRPGQADDDLSETVCGVQSGCQPGADDEKHHGG